MTKKATTVRDAVTKSKNTTASGKAGGSSWRDILINKDRKGGSK